MITMTVMNEEDKRKENEKNKKSKSGKKKDEGKSNKDGEGGEADYDDSMNSKAMAWR